MKIEKSLTPDKPYILTNGTEIIEEYGENELLCKYCSRVLAALELFHRSYDMLGCIACENKCPQVLRLSKKD